MLTVGAEARRGCELEQGLAPPEQCLCCLLAAFHLLHCSALAVLTFDDLGISEGCFASIGI